MSPRLPSVLFGLSMAATLGACASVPDPRSERPFASAAERHEIQVAQAGERLEIAVGHASALSDVGASAHSTSGLSGKTRSDIAAFASGYLRYGHGALILSTPSGGANSASASVVAQQARMALVESGVTYGAVAGSSYDASGQSDAPVILTFTRFEAEAPECAPIWEQDLAHQSNNQAWPSFGCATQANLAAMVEDPHDLLEPRAMDARDSGRRDAVMTHYRAGEGTANVRTPDERATISTVASQ